MQEYGISQKRYAVFAFVGTNAVLVRKIDTTWMNIKRLPPGGSSRRSRVRESALYENFHKLKVTRAPSVTLCVPPSSRRKAFFLPEGEQRTFEMSMSKVPLRYLCHRFIILIKLSYSIIGYNTVNIRLPPKIDFGRFGNIHFQSFLKICF